MGTYIRIFIILALTVAGFLAYIWLQSPASDVRKDVIATKAPEKAVAETTPLEDATYIKSADASPITGLPCRNHDSRPLAIVYSGDVETRPYFSGIDKAGFVVEMDHRYTHGGTRVMGIFECEKPDAVGPMRSGRVDLLAVAASFDAIYVPWGGDSISKNLLKKRIHNHIDCNSEVAPGGSPASCFRHSSAIVPLGGEDRAFASAPHLQAQAANVGYGTRNTFGGYRHKGEIPASQRPVVGVLRIGYMQGFEVSYQYNQETNSYERFFAGRAEYDFISKKRVAPKNVIVISAKKGTFNIGDQFKVDPWDGVETQYQKNDTGQYPNFALGDAWFDTERSGEARIYMNGQEIVGSWKKGDQARDPYIFLSAEGEEISFVPGQIWLQVVDTDRVVQWNSGASNE